LSRPVSTVVHYHEIALKGRNRPLFVARLVKNIETATSDLPVSRVVPLTGRVLVGCDQVLKQPRPAGPGHGCGSLRPATRAELTSMPSRQRRPRAQGVASRRSASAAGRTRDSSQFDEIDRLVGIGPASDRCRVSLGAPSSPSMSRSCPGGALHVDRLEGPRGPVGTGGGVAALLSAARLASGRYRMLKRGCRVLFVHFHARRLRQRQQKRELTVF
jgi:thiamine biosynthesis protein ThiI